MLHDLKNIFHIITIFQCLFFASYVWFVGRARRIAAGLLASVFVARAAAELGGVFFHFLALRKIVYARAPQLFYIDLPFDFLYLPLLYLYILSLTRKDFSLKKTFPVHLIWPAAIAVAAVLRFRLWDGDALRQLVGPDSRFGSIDQNVIVVLGLVQFVIYAWASLAALARHRSRVKDALSTVEPVNLSWLGFFIYGFIVWKSLDVAEYAVWLALGLGPWTISLYIISEITFLAFISLLFIKGLQQPAVFLNNGDQAQRPKYEKTLLNDDQKSLYKNRLVEYMESRKPYLDPGLSLTELARQVQVPPHHLSQVLNSCFDQNFFDFVNSYRIRESQRLLLERKFEDRTILDVLYETGFNSKSVFNTVFKKATGLTPSQFRKAQNSRSH